LTESAPERITWLRLSEEKVDTQEMIQVYFCFRLVKMVVRVAYMGKIIDSVRQGKEENTVGIVSSLREDIFCA
jgi:hypothetical protein